MNELKCRSESESAVEIIYWGFPLKVKVSLTNLEGIMLDREEIKFGGGGRDHGTMNTGRGRDDVWHYNVYRLEMKAKSRMVNFGWAILYALILIIIMVFTVILNTCNMFI